MVDDTRIEGIAELQTRLNALIRQLGPENVEPVLMKNARRLAVAIRRRIPRGETGKLRRAVRVKKLSPIGLNPCSALMAMTRRAPHAHLVEYGHALVKDGRVIGQVPPHPYFRPAVDELKEGIVRDVVQNLQRLIEEATR